MIICPWNFTHVKKNHKKQSSPSKFSIFFKVMEFKSDDFKMFTSIVWYDIVDDYDFLKLNIFLPLKIYLG
jgi:hypothetical protein